ncbi:UV-damage endonuclease [Xylariaceae sp. FL0804]|nr:UV-damage endonuclease [Xylariaceae sp. FL0804]
MYSSFRRLIRSCKAESGRRLGHFAPVPSCHITRPSVVFCRPVSVMGQKRSQPDMALLDQTPRVAEYPASPRPSAAPRRSGRNVKKADTGTDTKQDGLDHGDMQPPPDSPQMKRERKKAKASANEVIDELQEMEHRFQKSVKRQKLAINQSRTNGGPEHEATREEQAAFLPKASKPLPDVMDGHKEKDSLAKRSKRRKNGEQATDGENGTSDAEALAKAEDDDFIPDTPEETDVNTMKREGARPPPVNSDYLPLPWKGRLGYACLNTYLRQGNIPVFSSRTCRIASIIEHRHPLQDPSQPEHATKNRPDKDQPPDLARGQKYVENLGLANARDVIKMLRWNDKYHIKFMRLSSEMFPFASHEEYGYKLAPFAAETLAEVGKVAGELGHRLTTHPGQFTQLGSPRNEVVKNAVRDLEYHNEMLTLLRLPEQQNKDAVMILHMGGIFGDKGATLDRFRANYAKLSDGIKARLVLENDDVCWTVHDLLPICEELNIPMVLDFHHHNILFDADKIREGTKDIMDLYPRIKATWDRKGITQKMHYSEQCSEAVTPKQRRKHRPRVMTLPPCADDMDLMIEAKDKEQAVFDLMRNYRLPGWDSFNDIVPYERGDDNRPLPKTPQKKKKQPRSKKKRASDGGEDDNNDNNDKPDGVQEEEEEEQQQLKAEVAEADLGMGGPDNRVYWPVGMEEWLRPKKREVKKKKKGEGDENEE